MHYKSTLLVGCAVLLSAGAAQAGELQLTARNVNNVNPATGVPTAGAVEMDTDWVAVPQFPDTDQVTVESEDIVLSAARDFAGGKFMPAHWEVNLDDKIPSLNIVPGNANVIVRIALSGSSNPTWKQSFSPAEIVRAGGDNVNSQGAFGSLVAAGGNTATFSFDAAEGGETDIGFVLPVALNDCGDFIVTVTLSDPDLPGADRTATETLATCGPDSAFISNFVSPKDLKVDYALNNPFELFLVEDGRSGKGIELSDREDFGIIDFKVKNALFTLKAKSSDPSRRYVDAREIEDYTITFDFKDTSGLAGIRVFGTPGNTCPGTLYTPNASNQIVIFMTGAQVIDCFGLDGTDVGETIGLNGKQLGTALLQIFSSEDEPIKQQDISFVQEIDLLASPASLPAGETAANAMLSAAGNVIDANGETDAFRIVRAGLNFGPFDWSTSEGQVNSVFRASALPKLEQRDQHGNVVRGTVEGLTAYRGAIFVDHSSKGVEGACEFDVTGQVVNHEILFTRSLVSQILSGAAPATHCAGNTDLNNFGRADLTFTWFIPVEESQETDMDRLLNTNGVFASYGDNANDAFSLKARSCDPGRFGPHVANNLSGFAADALTLICGLGASNADIDDLFNIN
ncbi:MAG: hypothetical protein U5J99_08225 [Parvularculaceae bacterium]|nr:hypothetical protein [Parvularculaceae bacterium]